MALFKPKPSGAKKFTKASKYSTPEWNKFSSKFLSYNPNCYSCGAVAQVTDHIEAHKGNDELFWRQDNMMPLCKTCHSTVTQLFDRFTPPKTYEKLVWVTDKRIDTDTKVRVKVVPIQGRNDVNTPPKET